MVELTNALEDKQKQQMKVNAKHLLKLSYYLQFECNAKHFRSNIKGLSFTRYVFFGSFCLFSSTFGSIFTHTHRYYNQELYSYYVQYHP